MGPSLTGGDTALPAPAAGKLALPLLVTGPESFRLLALWTQRPGYIEQAHLALDGLTDFLRADGPLVVAGDLNSNAIWDSLHAPDDHSRFVQRMASLGLFSAYHEHHREPQGQESRKTFYFYRHADKPFHIDHVLLPDAWRPRLRGVDVGEHKPWATWSDHVPVTVDLGAA